MTSSQQSKTEWEIHRLQEWSKRERDGEGDTGETVEDSVH